MEIISVNIESKEQKAAITEGAEKLGVSPQDVEVTEAKGSAYTISLINSPGQFEIDARDDKMSAFLKIITPPVGSGNPVTIEDIEKSLSDMKIVYGIDKETLHSIVTEVQETGLLKKNVTIAKGTLPEKGEKARIELKIGRDAANSDPKASSMVKPGQVVAVKVPATMGKAGTNIFGEETPATPGEDIDFSAGDNVSLKDDGINLISKVYGAARGTWKDVSVTDFLRISKDGMWAEMSIYPVLADNNPLTLDDIIKILKDGGIKHGINESSIKDALDNAEPLEGFRIADTTPAKDGVNAEIDFKFMLSGDDPETVDNNRLKGIIDPSLVTKDIVCEGDVIAQKILAVKQEDGKTVTGILLKGVKPEDRRIKAGQNVTVLDDGLTYVVAKGVTAGYADYTKGTLLVESPLSISKDKLSASISIHPLSSTGNALTFEQVKKIIIRAGIKYGVDLKEIKKLLISTGNKEAHLKKMIAAKGKMPVIGDDAIIDFKFEHKKQVGSIIKDTDQMDFREQLFIHNVKKDDILAVKTPLTKGHNGMDIFGEAIPATPGKDNKLIAAGNVTTSNDCLSLIAEIDGMVSIGDGNKISIFKGHEVSGDVDLKTGNLTMDGSLVIKGWVRSGFIVSASGEIHISGGVEKAVVEAGAGLYVNGGVLGSDKIFSGGNLTAFFIENAIVHARGDIVLRDDMRNCNASTSSIIDVTGGKGRIIGGTLKALMGITANEIGSMAGVRTNIIVGIDQELNDRIDAASKRLEEFKRERSKIDMVLSRYSNKGKLSNIPKAVRFKLEKLIKHRRTTVRMETKLIEHRQNLIKKHDCSRDYSPTLTVNKTVYSGTRITIGDKTLEIDEAISGKIKFYLNSKSQMIETKK